MAERTRTWVAIGVVTVSRAVIVGVLAGAAPSASDRADALAASLKCPICVSESIADSPSQIARELRVVIEERIDEGWTDTEITDFFVATYGEEVLLDPASGGRSVVLWVAPVVVLALGVAVIVGLRSRPGRVLTEEERRRVAEALEEG